MINVAIGDIHGCIDQLKNLWSDIFSTLQNDYPDEKVRIVFLGDYIDRGPDSKGVIDFLIQLQDLYSHKFEFVFLKGNHEQMMLDHMEGYAFYYQETLKSYHVSLEEFAYDKEFIWLPKRHLEFYKNLKTYFLDKENNLFFCHAGIDENVPLLEQKEDTLLWLRVSGDYIKIGDMRVVHGHTPPRFEHFHHRINLDTGCVFGTALTAVIFKDDKTSIEVLQVPGLPSRERNYN